MNIYHQLRPVIDGFDGVFTPKQVDAIVKFIATDYDDRRVRIPRDIDVIFCDDFPLLSAYANLNRLLEFLGQCTPISVVDEHLNLFSDLIGKLKVYFDGAWLDDLLTFSHESKKIPDLVVQKRLEATKNHLEYTSEDHRTKLNYIRETRKQILAEIQQIKEGNKPKKEFTILLFTLTNNTMASKSHCSVTNDDTKPLHNRKPRQSFDDQLDELERSEQVLRESFRNLGELKEIFNNMLKDTEAKLMQVRTELTTVLKARTQVSSLEFDIFSPSIVRKKSEESCKAEPDLFQKHHDDDCCSLQQCCHMSCSEETWRGLTKK